MCLCVCLRYENEGACLYTRLTNVGGWECRWCSKESGQQLLPPPQTNKKNDQNINRSLKQ